MTNDLQEQRGDIELKQEVTEVITLDNLLYTEQNYPALHFVTENIADHSETMPHSPHYTVYDPAFDPMINIAENFEDTLALGELESKEENGFLTDKQEDALYPSYDNMLFLFLDNAISANQISPSFADEMINNSSLDNVDPTFENIETVDGSSKRDKITIKGKDSEVVYEIDSGDGNDVVRIKGVYNSSIVNLGSGNDKFIGGDSSDVIYGGAGKDILRGKGGADTFVFTKDDLSKTDIIKDFRPQDGDVIEIQDILSGFDHSVDVATDFILQTTKGKKTTISIDQDGSENGIGAVDLVVLHNMKGGIDIQGLFEEGQIVVV